MADEPEPDIPGGPSFWYVQIADIDGNVDQTRILRMPDGSHIPADDANADWREFQHWLAAGNTPKPPEPPPPRYIPLANVPLESDDPLARLERRVRQLEQRAQE